jgi:4a-hydroxytetrahydrobiopterin dehydratase
MGAKLSRKEISDSVGDLGWRYLLGRVRTSVLVLSLAQAANVAASAVEVCGEDADRHLIADIRQRRVILTLQSLDEAKVTPRDIELAGKITETVRAAGLRTEPEIGTGAARSIQMLEIGIDALNIPAIRPFWKAILGYGDEPGYDGPEGSIIDPVGQGPAIWFQQMDQPRPQRNRIHFDIAVPHDEVEKRVDAALKAGGKLLTAEYAPMFWVLADAEGNEACITTWQGRD